jgi:SAM-dependent methyltransferase
MERTQYELLARIQSEHWFYRHRARILESVLRDRAPGKTLELLDFGAGTGANVPVLEKWGRVTCMEPEPWAAGWIRDHHPNAAVHATLDEGAGTFDVILVSYVLYHQAIEDPEKTLRQLAARAKPGALLINFEPAFESLKRGLDRAVHTARRFDRHSLESLHTASGWQPRSTQYVLPTLFPAGWLIARLEAGKDAPPETPLEQHRSQGGPFSHAMDLWLNAVDRPLARAGLPFGIGLLTCSVRES